MFNSMLVRRVAVVRRPSDIQVGRIRRPCGPEALWKLRAMFLVSGRKATHSTVETVLQRLIHGPAPWVPCSTSGYYDVDSKISVSS